jgi:hypothetical protein
MDRKKLLPNGILCYDQIKKSQKIEYYLHTYLKIRILQVLG